MAEESPAWSPTALKCLLEQQDLVLRWYASETFDITKIFGLLMHTILFGKHLVSVDFEASATHHTHSYHEHCIALCKI